jgi:hypothetical protein
MKVEKKCEIVLFLGLGFVMCFNWFVFCNIWVCERWQRFPNKIRTKQPKKSRFGGILTIFKPIIYAVRICAFDELCYS